MFIKQLASYLLIILLLSGMISFLFFSTAREHLEEEMGRKLEEIATIVARNAPFERLDLIKVGDDRSRMVLRLKEKLSEIQEATGVKDIFIFRPDMLSLLDLNPEKKIGSVHHLERFSASFLDRLKQGHTVNTGGYRKNDDEFFISAYVPIKNPEGRLFAIVGIDAGTKELKIIEQMRTRLYWIIFASAIFLSLFAFFVARSITSPIRRIAQTAEKLGSGDYEARVEIKSLDELQTLADAINEMAEQIRKRDATLKEMAATVAHEIRNPLNSIKLLVSLIDEELLAQGNRTQGSTIETLYYEIGKLNRLISEFLTYARPTAFIYDVVSPESLASSVVEIASAQAKENLITLSMQIEAGLPDISVDRLRIEQCLFNLVLNALQACAPNGQVVVSVRRSKDPSTDGIDFVVEDTGPGISPNILPFIFDPFFTTKIDGTGLGLANTKKIVEQHGGKLRANNRKEGGARFVLHLPNDHVVSFKKSF